MYSYVLISSSSSFFPCKSVFLFHEQKLYVIVSSLQSLHISSSVTLINYSYHLTKLSSDDLFQCESTNSMTECFLYPSSNILAFLLFQNPWTPCRKMYFHCSFFLSHSSLGPVEFTPVMWVGNLPEFCWTSNWQ